MRKVLGTATVVAMVMSLASVALAGSGTFGEYRDEFKDGTFSGSVGSLDWSDDPWLEIGESDGYGAGAVHVDSEGDCVGSNCLHIFSEDGGLNGVGAQRHADTSVFYSFEICYEVRYEGSSETGADLLIEKSVDGGNQWYELTRFDLSEPFTSHPTHSFGQYDSMIVRFTVRGDMIGEVFIDDVEFKGEFKEGGGESSTTSTTKATTTTTRPTTTSTEARATTTTTVPAEITTTTTAETTTTTVASIVVVGGDDPPGEDPIRPFGSGIREPDRGIQASFDASLFGETGPLVLATDHQADFRLVAELIESTWVWLVVLALVLAWAIVSGLERRNQLLGGRSSS
ncbi:MAG: hypothetical protein ACR2NL_02030 [Acidimicrobiia bacterium]